MNRADEALCKGLQTTAIATSTLVLMDLVLTRPRAQTASDGPPRSETDAAFPRGLLSTREPASSRAVRLQCRLRPPRPE